MKWLKFLLPFNPVSISISAAFSEKFSEVEMHWLKKYSFAFEQLQIPCSFAAWDYATAWLVSPHSSLFY
jgi:hypothetical protein